MILVAWLELPLNKQQWNGRHWVCTSVADLWKILQTWKKRNQYLKLGDKFQQWVDPFDISDSSTDDALVMTVAGVVYKEKGNADEAFNIETKQRKELLLL